MEWASPFWLLLLLAAPFFRAKTGGISGWLPPVFIAFVVFALAGPSILIPSTSLPVFVVAPQAPAGEQAPALQAWWREAGPKLQEWLNAAETNSGQLVRRFYYDPRTLSPLFEASSQLSSGGTGTASPSFAEAWLQAHQKANQSEATVIAAILPSNIPSALLPRSPHANRIDEVCPPGLSDQSPTFTFVGELPPVPLPDVELFGIRLPTALREGQRFSVRATVLARKPSSATLRLYLNGLLHRERELDCQPGEQTVVFRGLQAKAGLLRAEAWLFPHSREPARESASTPEASLLSKTQASATTTTRPQAQRSQAAALVSGPLQAVLLTERPVGQMSALPFLSNSSIRWSPLTWDALENETSLRADVVVVPEFPRRISHQALEKLTSYVSRSGGALLVAGGPGSFGSAPPESWGLMNLLPLETTPQLLKESSQAALLVVLDRSGSMAQPAGELPKMALAAEGAIRALEQLPETDAFGITAVDVSPLVAWPLTTSQDRAAVRAAARAIQTGGGGIAIYPALRSAFEQLSTHPAPRRHILLFADADDVEEKWDGQRIGLPAGHSALDLAGDMRARGITLSVVALGTLKDKDTAYLRSLAERGGGRFHLAADARELPALFALEARAARGAPPPQEPFRPAPTAEGLRRLPPLPWSEAPFLRGLHTATAKPGAEVWLTDGQSRPLLAAWQFGMGRAAAFTSSFSEPWGAEFSKWRHAPELWGAVLAWLSPGEAPSRWQIETLASPNPARVTVQATAFDALVGQPVPPVPPSATLQPLDFRPAHQGGPVPVTWQPLGAGRWIAELPASITPALLTAILPQGTSSLIVNPPGAFHDDASPADSSPLKTWAEDVNAVVLSSWPSEPLKAPRRVSLSPAFALMAGLLLGALPLRPLFSARRPVPPQRPKTPPAPSRARRGPPRRAFQK